MTSEASKTGSKKVVFDFRSNSVIDQPENVADKKASLAVSPTGRSRAMTCPEPAASRFPKPSPVGTSDAGSPKPGHYDPRIGMAARQNNSDWGSRPIRSMSRDAREHVLNKNVYDGDVVPKGNIKSFAHCWQKKDARMGRSKSNASQGSPTSSRIGVKPVIGMKPAISHAQLVREAFICKTAQEMLKNFNSIVIDVKMQRGARIMWTTVPDDLKYIFNVTDIKTVDTWKQTMHGDCTLDISMFKKGDRVKMAIQSVGCSGKNMHQPLIRGVPDIAHHPDTIQKSNDTSPRLERAGSLGSRVGFGTASRARSRAATVGTPPSRTSAESEEKKTGVTLTRQYSHEDQALVDQHQPFSAKPKPAGRFRTLSQQRTSNKEFKHVSLRNRSNS